MEGESLSGSPFVITASASPEVGGAAGDWRTLRRGVAVSMDRWPMDLAAYVERTRSGPCFVCAFLAGNPGYSHETVFEDADHLAFLARWPTVPGKEA